MVLLAWRSRMEFDVGSMVDVGKKFREPMDRVPKSQSVCCVCLDRASLSLDPHESDESDESDGKPRQKRVGQFKSPK